MSKKVKSQIVESKLKEISDFAWRMPIRKKSINMPVILWKGTMPTEWRKEYTNSREPDGSGKLRRIQALIGFLFWGEALLKNGNMKKPALP